MWSDKLHLKKFLTFSVTTYYNTHFHSCADYLFLKIFLVSVGVFFSNLFRFNEMDCFKKA